MKKGNLVEIVKNNAVLYKIYKTVMSTVVNLFKIFIKTDDKLILFVSYGGRYFNDSPKCIYDMMKNDKRFDSYKLVWAFRDPDKYELDFKIKIDTFEYYKAALRARCWVTNVVIERGLNFKGKNTYYFHTTHGTLPKYTGNDVKDKKIFGSDFKYRYDCSCSQSSKESILQKSMFGISDKQILECGYPKNDILANPSQVVKKNTLHSLDIPLNKKIILYAPTFRESSMNNQLVIINWLKWKEVLGEDYIVLYRDHPVYAKNKKVNVPGFVFDVSLYPNNTDLMICADYLISDYSGIFFEYVILDRPMFCFAYDYDEYSKKRGLYMDLRKELPSGTEEEILNMIKNNDASIIEKVRAFKNKYVTQYGNATKQAVDNIYNNIA